MTELTFAYDVQLDEDENWIEQGTVVKVYDNPHCINRHKDSTPVVITEAFTYNGKKITFPPTVAWYSNQSFVELRK